jgi:hypothetical protein
MVVYCPVGRAIDDKNSVERAVEHRRIISKNVGGWWGQRLSLGLENANIKMLNYMRVIRQQKLPGIKMRIEEPRIQFYAETEEQLLNIVQTYIDSGDHQHIESIAGPKDTESEVILNSGGIIRKRDIGYTHKVILKDGKYPQEVRTGLLNYLNNLGKETAKIPDGLLKMLGNQSGFIWSAYFYVNDPSIVTFVNLMYPTLVSNIHELVVAPTK